MDLLTNLMSLLIIAGPIFIVIVVGAGFYRGARTAGNPSVPDVSGASSMPEKPGVVAWVVGALLAGWLIAALALGAAGFFEAVDGERVPGLSYALVPVLIGLGLLWLSPTFRQVLDRIPQHRLIGVQVYRVIGSVFLISYAQGKLPGEFAISAGIGDTVVGLTAPVVALLVLAQHPWAFRLAVVWNIVGLLDMAQAVTLGTLTAPGPLQRLALDAPSTLITTFPFVLVPVVLVPLSILLHIFSLRGLLLSRSASSGSSRTASPAAASVVC